MAANETISSITVVTLVSSGGRRIREHFPTRSRPPPHQRAKLDAMSRPPTNPRDEPPRTARFAFDADEGNTGRPQPGTEAPCAPRDLLEGLLAAVAAGTLSAEEAAGRLRAGEVRYLDGYAALDLGRAERKGVPEVVYALGKTAEQIAGICAAVLERHERAIVSRPTEETERHLRASLPDIPIRRAGRALVVGRGEPELTGGRIAAMSAGTSDLPVLEEAVAVAREMGVAVRCFNDVGVAGLHRLAGPLEELRAFDPDCVIVAAGMEGALPTVVSGLVSVHVVGLPTSTGYGLGGDGTAAILGMLQSCSPGLSVVNIDNGVGAGATAALVANRAAKRAATGG